jgi:hypothetical protein
VPYFTRHFNAILAAALAPHMPTFDSRRLAVTQAAASINARRRQTFTGEGGYYHSANTFTLDRKT